MGLAAALAPSPHRLQLQPKAWCAAGWGNQMPSDSTRSTSRSVASWRYVVVYLDIFARACLAAQIEDNDVWRFLKR